MKRGFTLIELLVVVLIIGILAAVALPQYRKAVERARVARILPYLRSIVEAKKRYYLENGEGTADLDLLDVGFSYSSRTIAENGSWKYQGTPLSGDFNLRSDTDCVYWPGGLGDVNIDFCDSYKVCYGSSQLGDAVCKSFGARKYSETSNGSFPAYYMDF